jgi:hypothetical protein
LKAYPPNATKIPSAVTENGVAGWVPYGYKALLNRCFDSAVLTYPFDFHSSFGRVVDHKADLRNATAPKSSACVTVHAGHRNDDLIF